MTTLLRAFVFVLTLSLVAGAASMWTSRASAQLVLRDGRRDTAVAGQPAQASPA